MDLETIIQNLVYRRELPRATIDDFCEQTKNQILGNQLKIVELVEKLKPALTNADHEVRLEGVKILINITVSMPYDLLGTMEIEVINEFLCMRLIDHKSMQPIVLKSFAYFVKCSAKPVNYDRSLLDFLSSKANVQKMEPSNRLLVYQIARTIIQDRSKISSTIDAELIYSFVNLIEGESHPRNLIVCFGMVSFILKTFQNLEPFIDDLFEWLSSYYPVEYTPDEQDEQQVGILRSDLVEALYDCFYATPLNAENLQTLLLEKLSSNLLSSKLESLECLIKCYDLFPYESIEKYSSTLWTAVRMDCLKKSDLVNPRLLDTSYEALHSLCKRLESGDPERLTSFLGDLLEELFIAFRKPEMDLFEPAAKLLTHAAKPKLSCFNMILGKILPVALNAITSNELRPLEGLAYIFEHVHISHPEARLSPDLVTNINKLFVKINTLIPTNSQAMRLLNAISSCKVGIDEEILRQTIERLFNDFDKSIEQAEESLAIICANYSRMEIISDRSNNLSNELSSLMELSKVFLTSLPGGDTNKLARLSAYTRLLILHLDSADSLRLGNIELGIITEHLANLRDIAIKVCDRSRIVENIGRIHSILINKLGDNIQSVLMQVFSSEYCQNLIPKEACDNSISAKVYLPIIGWCLKSLVLRNHELSVPLINLLLNFVTSDKVDHHLLRIACNMFGFVLSDEHSSSFNTQKHYRIFVLYKQKFFMQTSKEIKIRYAKHDEDSKKKILLCSLATQIPHLSPSVYKRDHEWLLRQLLMMLSRIDHKSCNSNPGEEQILYTFYGSVEALIQPGACDNLAGFLNTIVELNLKHATEAKMRIRQRALTCLLNVANSFKESDLMILKPMVMDKLRECLKDRKRLVRQAAANTRLKWSILGQPVGSN